MPDVTSLFPDAEPVGARPFESGATVRGTLTGPSLFPEDDQATRLRSAVEGAKSPDAAARVLRLQTKTGLPVELIERNVDEIEREASRADFDAEKFRRDSPKLAQWLAANPKHAEIAQGDMANLSRLDRLLGALQRGGYSLMQSGSAMSLGANARAMNEAEAIEQRLAAGEVPGSIPDALDAAGYRWMTPEQRSAYRHRLGAAAGGQVGSIATRQGQIEAIPVDPTIAAALGAKSFADFWDHFSQKPVEFILTVGAESLPQMAPALGLAVVGGVAGGLPLAAGGAGAGSFGVDYAASTLAALREEGVDLKDRDAIAAAVADRDLMKRVGQKAFSHAAPVAAFDAASGALAGLRLVPARQVAGVAAAKPSAGAVAASAGRAGADLGAQATAQGAVGAAGEAAGLAASGQDLDAGSIMAEFFGEFATAPAEVGGMAAAGVRRNMREQLRAKERQAFFEALGEGVSSSATFQRMPEKLREYIAQATRDGPVENVYVPVQAWAQFWQSQNVDPREAAAEVMGRTELYEEAVRTGADIAIPLADYAIKIAPNAQANAAFSSEIRLRADELNAREAAEVEAELSKQASTAAEAPGATSAQKVREDIVGQLSGLGFDRGTIDAYASMYERTFATMGERSGVDPFELYSRYGLRVNRPMPEVLQPADKVDALDALLDRVRSMDVKSGEDMVGESLLPFLRKRGLQDMSGELAGREVDKNLKPFQRKLVRDDGMSLDDAMQAAIEAGYFTEDEADVTNLLSAIDEELAGRPRFAVKNVDERAMQTNDAVMALAQHLETLGIDLNAMSNAEIKKALAAASGIEGEIGDVVFEQGDERQIQVDGKWRPVVNSEGQPLGRTFADQLAFWRWFGDSKVVDEVGRPLVVYRGGATEDWRTGAEITEFRSSNGPWAGFFTSDSETASRFASAQYGMTLRGGAPAGVFPVYLRIVDPLEVDAAGANAREFQIDASVVGQKDHPVRDEFLNGNRDGLIIRNTADEGDVFVPRGPEQIKSVFNRGTFDPLSGNILYQITPDQARELNTPVDLPADPIFEEAVANTPGAEITEDGLLIDIVRFQKPEQEGAQAIRTGVFYLPARSKDVKHYKGGKTGYGGTEKHEGETLLRRPLFVKGATGGNAVKAAYDLLKGKGAYESMRDDVLKIALGWGKTSQQKVEGVAEVLEKYGGDSGMAREIVNVSREGNTLPYAVQEHIAAHAVREAGYDSVLGYSKGRGENGAFFLSEVFDVREQTFPARGMDSDIHERFYDQEMSEGKRGRIAFGEDRQFNIDLFARADLSTFIHESGHFYLEVFGDVVEKISAQDPATWTDAQRQMVRDYGDLLEWLDVANRAEIGVEQHEQFARGLEAYMRDGKAPSRELRSVFAKFRAWLVNIYRSLTQLRVELSPEVRAVMDRLLATDAEIEAAQREADIAPLFLDAAAAGMSAQEFAAYSETVREAGERARDELQAKLFAQMKREQQAWWRQERETMMREVQAEVYGQREYIALSVLQRGTLPDGSPLPEGVQAVKLNRDWLVDSYGKEFLKRLPRPYVYAREGGVNPEVAAAMFGFNSGDELVMAIANARPMRQLIEAETDQRMRERHGDMMLDGTIAEAAKVAVNGLGRAQIVEAELKALNRAMAGSVIPPADVINGMARDWIARQKVRDLRPTAYLMAAQRAAKEAFDLVGTKNDRQGAMRAKLRERMNLALYREATAAQETTEATVEYFRGFDRKGKRERIGKAGGDFLDQIDGLLDRFEFKKVTLKVLERRKALAQWVAEKEKQGLPVNLPPGLVDEARRQNYREMTVEELAGLRDAVRHIEHLATLKNKLLKAKAKRDLDEAVADITGSIREHAKKRPRKIETRLPSDEAGRLVSGWFASHRKLASFARQMDGFEDGGQVWEYIVRPINEAADAEAAMKEEATIKLGALFGAYRGKDAAELYRKRHIPEINASLTKMGRLMVALNWGNEGNRQRVMSGYGWNEKQVEAILATLDGRDWKFVQGVWDFIDSYWPQIEAKEKRVDGVAPAKVERAKLTVTIDGQPVEIAGGYFPIKYDERQSAQAGANLESEFADLAKKASYTRATTRRGHTEARVEKVEMPVRLDFGVVFEHVGQVIHDLTHHEMLIDAGRLLGNKELQAAIYETYGDVVFREIKKTLVDIAHGDTPPANAWEASISHLRQGVSIAYMGWNVMTSLQQPLGLFNSIQRVGAKWVSKGLTRWLRDAASLENTARWVYDRSEFMRLRHKTQQREISEIRNQVGVQSGKLAGWVDEALRTVSADHLTKQAIADSYFWLIAKAQQVADIPTWLGAYEKAMAAGETEDRAASLADQAVIDTQGGGQIKDLASVQRGGPMLKLWTNFYSFFNTTWNLGVEATRRTNFRDPISIGRLAVDYLLLTVMPATMGALIKHAITGPDDDDDELARRLARENVSYLLGMMVGLREIGAASMGFYGYEGPAGARFFATFGKLTKQAGQGEADAAFWKSLNESAGILLHYPAGQVKRTVEGFDALAEGETRNPLALIFGAPK